MGVGVVVNQNFQFILQYINKSRKLKSQLNNLGNYFWVGFGGVSVMVHQTLSNYFSRYNAYEKIFLAGVWWG